MWFISYRLAVFILHFFLKLNSRSICCVYSPIRVGLYSDVMGYKRHCSPCTPAHMSHCQRPLPAQRFLLDPVTERHSFITQQTESKVKHTTDLTAEGSYKPKWRQEQVATAELTAVSSHQQQKWKIILKKLFNTTKKPPTANSDIQCKHTQQDTAFSEVK